MHREHMTVVIVGHVDHGKSTVIGRLLADTGSLPEGKLDQVKATCARNAKPFEYAFLLDALKDERSQGITIDAARCFFKTARRDYIILDAPGHIEFLKNMVTGASRAEVAILVIDAKQGVQENTRRHGMVVSMIGVKRILVLVNKMDLVGYDQAAFERVSNAFRAFLKEIDIEPIAFIPVSAFQGDNLISTSQRMPWYQGRPFLGELDLIPVKEQPANLPLRFPVQDIYKFTENGDERRIIAGTLATGTARAGDPVVFYPSGKRSTIRSVEEFNTPPRQDAASGEAIGFTLTDELYLRPGEIMTRQDARPPRTATQFKANIFWVGRTPFVKDKTYKLKIGTAQSPVKLVDILRIIDAQDLSSAARQDSINRHDVATCVLEVTRPIAYDLAQDIEALSRFVIVDHFEIAGGGIIIDELRPDASTLEQHVTNREKRWVHGLVLPAERAAAYRHKGQFIIVTGNSAEKNGAVARLLERSLFDNGRKAYYLNTANLTCGLTDGSTDVADAREEEIRVLGELGRVLTDAGHIVVTDLNHYDAYDIARLKTFVHPFEVLVVGLGASAPETTLSLNDAMSPGDTAAVICQWLRDMDILPDYSL